MIVAKLMIIFSAISALEAQDFGGYKHVTFNIPLFGKPEVKQYSINDQTLIKSSESNYAFTTTLALWKDIQAVSVNDNQIVMYSPTCQTTTKALDELNSEEQTDLTEEMAVLIEYPNFKNEYTNTDEGVSVSISGTTADCKDGSISTDETTKMTTVQTQRRSYSIESRRMRDDLARVFVHYDVVAFVYLNGTVHMKPLLCTSPNELELQRTKKKSIVS